MSFIRTPDEMFSRAKPRLVRACATALMLALLLARASVAAAATYYVDGANPNGTDSGPGSIVTPYRTIQAAVTARAAAGNTIIVQPAIYRETVTLSASGSSGNRIVLLAAAPGVIVNGADDFAATSKWSPVSGSVFLAPSVTWSPLQVFSNGVRLTRSAVAPASLPSGSFTYVSGAGLYVNLGGDNPGARGCEVGRRSNAFVVNGQYVTIDGFTATRTEDLAIDPASNATIQNCTVTFANSYGIKVHGRTGVQVLHNSVSDNNDHGIYLSSGSTNCTISNNESYRNARPAVRAANGIDVDGSASCTVENNRCHDNQDTGIQFYNGANNCVSNDNLSWNNGDHGFDHLRTSGVRHTHDVAYGNYKDGFSFEGTSPGCALYNCIAIDNGLTTDEFDLWVDGTSTSGFVSDYNIFWNSSPQVPIKFISTRYSSVSVFSAATGQDTHSIQADARFVNPVLGDFHLVSGSPAIDDANTSVTGEAPVDAEGGARRDDPATPNTGVGPVTYADRGALEFVPAAVDRAPRVSVAPAATVIERDSLTLTVTASDPDGDPILSLTANPSSLPVPNNAVFTPNETNAGGTFTWTPRHEDGHGPYAVSFTAMTANGAADSGRVLVTVEHRPVVTATEFVSVAEGALLSVTVGASDPDGQPIAALTAELGALPAGNDAVFTTSGDNRSGTLTWTPAFDHAGGPYRVTFIAANALVDSAAMAITVTNVDRTPQVSVVPAASVTENDPLTLAVTASDPDGDPIVSLTLVPSSVPATTGAVFAVNESNTGGTFTWTPGHEVARGPHAVSFVALTANGAADSGSVSITVEHHPVVSVAQAVGVRERERLALDVSAADPDGDAITSLAADLTGLPAGSDAIFTPDGSNAGGTLVWTPTYADAPRTYVVTFTARSGGAAASPASGARWTMELAGSASSSITVDNVDAPPAVTAPAALLTDGSTLSIGITASDFDGDSILSLMADVSQLPAGDEKTFTLNSSNTGGTLTWTPHENDAHGPYQITFVASNALADTARTSVTYDRAPIVTVVPRDSVDENQPLTLGVTATDPDGDAIDSLTAALDSLPPGGDAAFAQDGTHTGGTLSWTPTFDDSGTYHLTFTASNARIASGTAQITVRNVDRAPIVGVRPAARGIENENLSFTASAMDLDGDPIASFDAIGLPPGATFTINDARTVGVFTWTPAPEDIRADPYTVTFIATNALSGSDTTTVTVGDLSTAAPTGEDAVSFGVSATPNPMRATGTLSFGITESGPVQLQIFDLAGRMVREPLPATSLRAGAYRVTLRAREGASRMPAGAYFYRLRAAEGVKVGRFVVME